ncbi:hypothetical protein ACP4OV_009453 [Aristida adscensionis]
MPTATEMAAPARQQPASGAPVAPLRPGLRVVDTVVVLPSPSAGPTLPESSLPLTFFDVCMIALPPIERVFFYRLAPGAAAAAVVSGLRDSLSRAVRAFYPLAGRLRRTPGAAANRYELYYRPGDGATFTFAEYDGADFDSLAADEPREVAKIAPLVPPLPGGGAVLAVQATLLHSARGGRGLAVAVAVNHAACDGAASTHFLHTWAAAGRLDAGGQAPPPPPPVIDRTLLPDTRGLYDLFSQAAAGAGEETGERVTVSPDKLLLATFALSKDDVQRVKDAVAGEAARRGVAPPPRCSSLVATLGLVWSCYERTKEEEDDDAAAAAAAAASRHDGDQPMASLLFPVDHRTRMSPPLPYKYFGNCVGPALALAPRAELAAGAGAGVLFTACAAAAAAIDEALRGVGTPSMDAWMQRIGEVSKATGGLLAVSGSPRFRVYELDLGFGPPAKVDIVSAARTGVVAVAESRNSGGGMEVGVSLQPAAMDRFRKRFAEAVACLS